MRRSVRGQDYRDPGLMAFDFKAPLPDHPLSQDPLDGALNLFRKGSALVDRAVIAFASIVPLVPMLTIPEKRQAAFETFREAIAWASLDGDNLLAAREGWAEDRPFVIFALVRQKAGTLAVRSIEIDRRSLALTGDDETDSPYPLDRLETVSKDAAELCDAIETMRAHVAAATSRLSIVKTRLDLQSSFLTAVVDADSGSPVVRLDSHLNHSGAREMALATRRLLGRQSLNIANTNRKKLQTLFERHAPLSA